jgi:hypothetical protein
VAGMLERAQESRHVVCSHQGVVEVASQHVVQARQFEVGMQVGG